MPTSQSTEPIVVHKYGGSSVADSAHLRRVAKRIVRARESGKRVVVVVSAMASTTDDLLRRAQDVSKAPSRRELDMLLSCGERASMALLAMAVHQLGHEAVSLTGSQSGIMTNDRHSGARIIEVRPIRVMDELQRGKIVIVAGFQGVSYKREITTLGRGGSDTTAVALAGALGAEYCEICSDVDGVYSADPRVVKSAQFLEAIRSDQMLELSAHGAKVLHAGCVEIAARADIKLIACATAKDGGGTRIDRIGMPNQNDWVGCTGLKGLVKLRFPRADSLLKIAVDQQIEILHFGSQEQMSELWFSLANCQDWPALRDACAGDSIEISESLGAVSIVGDALGADASKIQLVRSIAADMGIKVMGLSTSPLRVSVFCAESEVDILVRSLHSRLIELDS